jgi:hypothetical protein
LCPVSQPAGVDCPIGLQPVVVLVCASLDFQVVVQDVEAMGKMKAEVIEPLLEQAAIAAAATFVPSGNSMAATNPTHASFHL